MTLKTIINRVERKLTLDVSTTIIGNTDPNVRVLLECCNEEGKELTKRYPWQALQKEQTFTATATETQSNVLPADMGNPKRFVRDTIFNRTRKRPVRGPLNAQEWQAEKSLEVTSVYDAFRIRGNDWLSLPTATAGDEYAFEYISSYWVDTDNDGDGDAEEWAADTNATLLSEDLVYLGTVWRFLASRKLAYAEEFATYEKQVAQDSSRDAVPRILDYSEDPGRFDQIPGAVVTEGNWNL